MRDDLASVLHELDPGSSDEDPLSCAGVADPVEQDYVPDAPTGSARSSFRVSVGGVGGSMLTVCNIYIWRCITLVCDRSRRALK